MAEEQELNVLLLADRFQLRGSTRQTLKLAEHLPDYLIRPLVITPDAEIVPRGKQEAFNIRVYRYLNMHGVGAVILRYLLQDLKNEPLDLIHIQSRSMLPLGMWLARKLEIPFILSVHDYVPPGQLLKFDHRFGRAIIAVSGSVKSELLTQPALTGDLITVIHSGVEIPILIDLPEVLGADHVPVIGTAGPLEAIKGLPFFLEAAKLVLESGQSAEFLIAGSGPEEKNLREKSRQLGIREHVTFISNLADFSESLDAMDVFCLPSLQQGLGTIMLEAMLLARPVVASRVGGVYSVIHDQQTGMLVPPSNSELLAEKLIWILQHPEEAQQIGSAGQRYVEENFRVDQMVKRVAELYHQIVQEERSTASSTSPKSEASIPHS